MNDDLSLINQESQLKNLIDNLLKEKGVDGLRDWLLNCPETKVDWDGARYALRLISKNSPESWPFDLVKLAVEAESEVVRHRIRHWELEPIIHKLDYAELMALIERIRVYLNSKNSSWAVRAVKCIWTIGYRYDGAFEDLTLLASQFPDSSEEKAIVINVAAFLGVLPIANLSTEIKALLKSNQGYSQGLSHLVALYGDANDFAYLEKFFSNHEHCHDVLLAMLMMCLRVPDVREVAQRCFLGADLSQRWGLDHFAVRVFDSKELILQYLDMIFSAWEGGGEGLPQLTLLNSCLKESHLELLGQFKSSITPERLTMLETLVVNPSGNAGLMNSSSTYRKEMAITLASRLGLAELKTWLPKAMEDEVNRGLIKRVAQDCCFFNVPDFILPLKNVLKLEGGIASADPEHPREFGFQQQTIDNPIWLLSEEAGVTGSEATLRLLLESDGRHGMDQALMSYVEGLAFAAVNAGSTNLITRVMLDESQPSWRRAAAAHALRTADLYAPTPETDWSVAESFVTDLSQDRFARLELLIALAEHDAEGAKSAITRLPEEEQGVSQVLLARIIARFEVDIAISGLESYLNNAGHTSKRSFERAYAALCVARLYQMGDVTGDEAACYLQSGLQDELIQFCMSCEVIAEKDQSLFDTVWMGALNCNTRSMSYPALWQAVGRFRPQHLVTEEALTYVQTTTDSSVKGFLDALIEQRHQLSDQSEQTWPFLLKLMQERSRAVGWYASFVAASICNDKSREYIQSTLSDDVELRIAIECALWLDEESWVGAFEKAKLARWRKVRDYALELNEEREKLRSADVYLGKVITATDRLQDWRYAQALLQLPSERVLQRLQEWDVETIQNGYLSNWLQKEIGNALKRREKLFEKFRLPGEDAFPRWF